ncbi:MAG TPA: DUF881 domain-containing protein [Actinomycetes bacterium]
MPAPTRGGALGRPDASMSLLTNLAENSLDEGYAEAAARRVEEQRGPWRPGWLLALGLLGVGLLLATSAAQVRERAPAAAVARAALTKEVQRRTAATDRLEADLDRLRASVAKARQDALALTASGSQLATQIDQLEGATGAAPVVGPGVVVHLEDAPTDQAPGADVNPRTSDTTPQGRVTDRDLQTIVNELWAAGAEAIAVNGERLTTLSAIRSAGEAVLVDFRPISPPYDVIAIGDARRVQSAFAEGFGGSYLQVLKGYGISYSIETKKSVRLPASGGITVRYATVPGKTEVRP